jgi:predicted RNase H-like HicB family nuclease
MLPITPRGVAQSGSALGWGPSGRRFKSCLPDIANDTREIELIFEPQEDGGYHVYAPELPGLHTQGEDMDDALANANEAVALYVEGLREDGESLDMGIVRRRITLPA